jgi:hypothetical protein
MNMYFQVYACHLLPYFNEEHLFFAWPPLIGKRESRVVEKILSQNAKIAIDS